MTKIFFVMANYLRMMFLKFHFDSFRNPNNFNNFVGLFRLNIIKGANEKSG